MYNKERARDHKERGIDIKTWSPLGIEHINRTELNIVNVELNGQSTRYTGHVWLPHKWRPGMTVTVDWDIDPNTRVIPFKISMNTEEREAYNEAEKIHVSKYIHHQVVVIVPYYTQKDLCGVLANLLPENKVDLEVTCTVSKFDK